VILDSRKADMAFGQIPRGALNPLRVKVKGHQRTRFVVFSLVLNLASGFLGLS